MKKLFVVLWLAALFGSAFAQCPIKSATEKIVKPLICLDTLGRSATPDSAHITTYKDDASFATYFARSATYPFTAASIDTTRPPIGGTAPVLYWLSETISNIDGTASNATLAINVQLWWKGYATDNMFCVQMVPDSLSDVIWRLALATAAPVGTTSDSAKVSGTALSGLNNVIKTNSFAAGAIDANAIAPNAITNSEFSVTVLDNDTSFTGLQTTIQSIKTQTDKFAFTVANKVDANVYTWNGTAVTTPVVAGSPVVTLGARGSDADTGIVAMKTKLTTIAGYTDDIGTAGAGLTSVKLASTGSDADTGIVALKTKLTTIAGYAKSVDDTVKAHAPHANNWGGTAAGGSGADSGVVARVVQRSWGIQLGTSGSSDSLTAAQRQSALSPSSARLGVNTLQLNGTSQTARDIGASVLLSSGTGTGQLSITSGIAAVNATQIAGSAVSATTAQLGVNVVNYNNQAVSTTVSGMPLVTLGSRGSDADTGIVAIKTKLTTIAGYTDDIGTAGAGLTSVKLAATGSDADTGIVALKTKLTTIAGYAKSVDDTVKAHAPHGNNWASTGTSTGANVDSIRDIIGDSLATFANAHAITDSMRLVAHDSTRLFVQGVKDKTDSLKFAGALTNPSFLRPTTAGRTLDVNAGGEAGLDFDNTSGTLAKTTDITGFNDIAATAIVSSGAITTSGGAVSTVTTTTTATNLTNAPTNGDLTATMKSSIGTQVWTTSTPRQLTGNFADTTAAKVWATGTKAITSVGTGAVTTSSFATGAIDAAAIATGALDFGVEIDTAGDESGVKTEATTGGGGATAADIWSYGTRTLTSGAVSASVYPLMQISTVVDNPGTLTRYQFVIDTTSCGGSNEYALLNKAVTLRDTSTSWGKPYFNGIIERANCVAGSCTLQVSDSCAFPIAAGDSLWIWNGGPQYVMATLAEAAAGTADSVLDADTSAHLGAGSTGLAIARGGTGGSGGDSTGVKEMLINNGYAASKDSALAMANTSTGAGVLRRSEVPTLTETGDTLAGRIPDSTYAKGGVVDTARNASGLTSGGSGGCPDSIGNAWTITAWDSINNVAVTNAVISLKSSVNSSGVLAQSSSSPFTFTKANGSAAVVVTANGVTFPVRTITITGTRNDTIFGGGIIVAAADSPSEATVYGTVDCPSCYVRFELMAQGAVTDTSTGYLISRKVYNIKTNSIGFFSRSLLKTENLLYQSGTQRLQPKWKITISPTDVVREPLLEQTFSVDSDSTSLDIGGLIR